MRKLIFCLPVVIGMLLLVAACGDKKKVSYPYTEHEIIYLGLKSGLTSSSSNAAFDNALNEVLQAWLAKNPSSSNEFILDGITYEFTNLREATGGIPESIWDLFWDELDEYSYSIGSCWAFSYFQIPSKGKAGTLYVLYTIVTDVGWDAEVRYAAVRGDVTPKSKTRSGGIFREDLQSILNFAKFEHKSKTSN